ncbi:hypothetical protein [Formivibrio citricus]|uniref:hypothetical protein n=1 Tax=Formivibrio citricus TaxID=83765 RepID=UPI000B8202D5|nr:hypothetical protein [Formivibrio citricus]
MKIRPFEAVGDVTFGMSCDAVTNTLGLPVRDGLSRKAEMELHYPNACYRFDSNSTLVEVTVDATVIEFGAISVPFKVLVPFLKQQDATVFEKVGFVVSPELGIALDPAFSSWVTVFSRQRLQQWQGI